MKSKISFFILIMFSFGFAKVQAQTPWRDVWAASGDYFHNSYGSLSWTIGEDITETFTNSSATTILTQGFQQSDDLHASIPEIDVENQFVIYPNPGNGQIYISFNTLEVYDIIIQLYDVAGRLIKVDKTSTIASPHNIDINSFSSNCYFMTISKADGKILCSKTIIKY